MTKTKRPTGTKGEELIEKLCPLVQIKRSRSSDLLSVANIRFEVKSARPHSNNGYLFYLKGTKFQHRWAESYILVAFDEEFNLEKIYLVPRKELIGVKHIWLGPETEDRWNQFRIG